ATHARLAPLRRRQVREPGADDADGRLGLPEGAARVVLRHAAPHAGLPAADRDGTGVALFHAAHLRLARDLARSLDDAHRARRGARPDRSRLERAGLPFALGGPPPVSPAPRRARGTAAARRD